MFTDAGSTLYNHVTLTFDFLTSGSMQAEVLQQSICVPSLVLIAQAVFVSEPSTHTDTQSQTPLITVPTHQLPVVG